MISLVCVFAVGLSLVNAYIAYKNLVLATKNEEVGKLLLSLATRLEQQWKELR